jgi:hypothetical protein
VVVLLPQVEEVLFQVVLQVEEVLLQVLKEK